MNRNKKILYAQKIIKSYKKINNMFIFKCNDIYYISRFYGVTSKRYTKIKTNYHYCDIWDFIVPFYYYIECMNINELERIIFEHLI